MMSRRIFVQVHEFASLRRIEPDNTSGATSKRGIDMAIKTGIVGAAGFAGIELVRLVLRHPDLELAVATSNELAGTRIDAEYPGFAGAADLAFATHDDPALAACELVFLAVPHTAALAMAPRLVAGGATVIDLSADFRLKDPAVYEQWYNTPHTACDLLARAAFGLPELFPDDLARAARARANGEPALVACAGCYPTATSLAEAPAIRAGFATPSGTVVVDAISGVTGAGKKATARTHFCFADENLEAYGVGTHRHTPEIEQILGIAGQGRLVFTPHLAPLNRGLLSTANIPLAPDASDARRRLPAEDLLGRRHEQRPYRPCRERARAHAGRRVRHRQPGQGRGRPGRAVREHRLRPARATRLRRRRRARLIEGTR